MAYSPALQQLVLSRLDDSIRDLKSLGDPAIRDEYARSVLTRYFLGQIDECQLPPMARAFLNSYSRNVEA